MCLKEIKVFRIKNESKLFQIKYLKLKYHIKIELPNIILMGFLNHLPHPFILFS